MMKQKRQRWLLAWADTNVAMVRNMDGRRWDRNRMMTLLAAMLLLAVVVYWGVALVGPVSAAAASEAHTQQPALPGFDAAASVPLVRLLSPGAVQTDVAVLGVMAGEYAPLALLSVDGQPAQAYAPGQRLGPSTVLVRISASAVELQQAGQPRSLPVPALPPVPAEGIVPAVAQDGTP
ncbi:general secretion pathway protein C [Stenotrophomonas sp. AN71]